ncbi:Calcium channel flower [Tyrophagus putrescentiae]|nr:Calcium channel flower [Tyrophagus putrescentiae]
MNVFNTILRSQQPLAQTGQEAPAGGNDTPWMITTAAKSIGSVAGVVSCFMGFLNLLSILDVKCIFAGAILIIEGFLMVLTEAPCCCMFLDFAYMPANLLDKRSPWFKAVIYLMFAAVPFFMCVGVSTFLSCGLMMATSAFYVLMAMGKKANRDEMRVKSASTAGGQGQQGQGTITTAPTAVLVQNEELPAPTMANKGGSQVIY